VDGNWNLLSNNPFFTYKNTQGGSFMNKFLKRLAVGVLSLAMVAGLTASVPATTVKAAEAL